MKAILLFLIRLYQQTNLFPNYCRFMPTCSEYMYQAVEKYGAAKGTWLGIRRITRCHPGNKGGYDPVL